MRKLLERRMGPEWAEWAEAAARFRQKVLSAHLCRAEQERCFDAFFDASVDAQCLRARVPTASEQSLILRPQETKLEPCRLLPKARKPVCRGFVSLVGAGPGDPGLLTIKAKKRLLRADAVVYDRLAATSLPCDLRPDVELHPVGKQAQHHPVPQEEINALLVRLGRAGKQVVRLKGGDPFVFGRGGEEALALVEAGIRFEVLPAVTAGVAVPAYAGIPVTHRGKAVRLILVTAHESEKDTGPQVRWDLMAQDPYTTLVGFMGVRNLPQVVKRLLSAGMDPETPAALIQRGTTSAQKSVCSTLSQLNRDGQQAGIRPPAVFVIGSTIDLAATLSWAERRPLHGQRLLFPGPSGPLAEALEDEGAELVVVPLPVTPAARVVMDALPLSGCVFSSPDQVDSIENERASRSFGPTLCAWCLDQETAQRARKLGWSDIQVVPDADALIAAFLKA
jgi:uroporphyrin-III C-methyltransferase